MSPCGAARLRHDCVIIGAAALPGITAIGHLLCRHPVIGASGGCLLAIADILTSAKAAGTF